MKKNLFVVLASLLLLACGKSEPNLAPKDNGHRKAPDTYIYTPLQKYIQKIKKKYPSIYLDLDSPYSEMDRDLIFLSGRKEGKLWLGCFNKKTEKELLDWMDTKPLDTVLTINKGYGEYETLKCKRFKIDGDVSRKLNNSFCILFWGGDDSKIIFSKLYFINNNKAVSKTIIYPFYLSRVDSWTKNTLLAYINNADEYGLKEVICYNTKGDSLFSVKSPSNFENKNKDSFCRSIVDDRGEEVIYFFKLRDDDSLIRYNLKTDKIVWENKKSPFSKLQKDIKIKKIDINKKGNMWEYTINYIQYDGKKGVLKFILNIKDGQYSMK